MLSDRGARYVTFGFDNPLALSHWAAVKTGTSKDMRENWCIGYSRRYLVAVWVGNFEGDSMRDVNARNVASDLYHAARGSWDDAVELGRHAMQHQAAGTMLMPPFYFNAPRDAGVLAHDRRRHGCCLRHSCFARRPTGCRGYGRRDAAPAAARAPRRALRRRYSP